MIAINGEIGFDSYYCFGNYYAIFSSCLIFYIKHIRHDNGIQLVLMFNEYETCTFLSPSEEERYPLSQHPIIIPSFLVPKMGLLRREQHATTDHLHG